MFIRLECIIIILNKMHLLLRKNGQKKKANSNSIKGIVHPKMKSWCLSAYPQGIQDVGDFVSSVEHKHF